MRTLLFRCAALLLLTACCPGCAALSLFSTTHEHHYENNPEVNQRLSMLEARLEAMDKAMFSPPAETNGPVVAPPK